MREEDLPALDALGIMAEAGVGETDLLRMARVWGDGTRRIAQYVPHHFHEAVERGFRERGLGDNQAFEAAIRDVGMRMGRSGEDLLGWLFRRHSEVFMTAHQLDHVETALDDAGVRRRPARTPEAAVFADLSGYTRLTEESGDVVAADAALAFAQLVGEVATQHRGSIVKLLGDGVLLHFPDPGDAVRASLDLVERAPAQGLPATHIGVNAGPMLYDQGDYFGRTVNVASRIASHAPAGRVYAGESLVGTADHQGFTLSELGVFELKGVAKPMTLYEASPRPALLTSSEANHRNLARGPRPIHRILRRLLGDPLPGPLELIALEPLGVDQDASAIGEDNGRIRLRGEVGNPRRVRRGAALGGDDQPAIGPLLEVSQHGVTNHSGPSPDRLEHEGMEATGGPELAGTLPVDRIARPPSLVNHVPRLARNMPGPCARYAWGSAAHCTRVVR